MRHAPTVTCDFCEQTIATDVPWTTIDVAVPKDVAEQVHEQWKKDAPAAMFPGMTFHVPTPTHVTLDLCPACQNDRSPDLSPLAAVRVITALEKRRAQAAKAGAAAQMKDRD